MSERTPLLKIGVMKAGFHISGVVPWVKDRLNNKERGLHRATAQFFMKNGDIPSGPLQKDGSSLLIILKISSSDIEQTQPPWSGIEPFALKKLVRSNSTIGEVSKFA